MAGSSKEGKDKKAPKEEASSTGNAALLRRLSEDLSALRSEVEALKGSLPLATAIVPPDERPRTKVSATSDDNSGLEARLQNLLTQPVDAAVTIAYVFRGQEAEGTTIASSSFGTTGGLASILATDDARVARLAYALSSPQKVGLLRALLTDGTQSAAQLGEKTNLTTGSLYHHLRELTHAGVIEAAGRNRIALTERGRAATLLLFVQAAGDTSEAS